MNEVLDEILLLAESIADNFYMQRDKEAYNDLNHLLSLIEKYIVGVSQIGEGSVVYSVMSILGQILNALSDKDGVLIADLLHFELAGALEASK